MLSRESHKDASPFLPSVACYEYDAHSHHSDSYYNQWKVSTINTLLFDEDRTAIMARSSLDLSKIILPTRKKINLFVESSSVKTNPS